MPDNYYTKAKKRVAKEKGEATTYPLIGKSAGHFTRGLALIGALLTGPRDEIKEVEKKTRKRP